MPFQKGSDGVWTLTVGPLAPDMYVYHLLVDGVQMADPNNTVGGVTAMPPVQPARHPRRARPTTTRGTSRTAR